MPLAEAEIRPRKPLFHLTTADQILADLKTAIGELSPRSSQARALALAEFKKALANARKTGELCDLDTIRPVGRPRSDFVQEDHLALPFAHFHRMIGEPA